MFLAHGAAGLTIAYLTKRIWAKNSFSAKELALLYSSSIIAGDIPDLDLAYALLDGVSSHHSYITHTPFPYVLLSLALFLFSLTLNNKKRKLLQSFCFIFLSTILLHLFTDSFAGSIKLFYPFIDKPFTLFQLAPLVQSSNIIIQYFTTPIFILIEGTFLIAACLILTYKLKHNKIVFRYTSLVLSLSCTMAAIATGVFLILL